MIGRTLSHFRIVEKLGEGGMGVVYRAEDTKLRRQVALKVLPPELVGNEERRLRFLREARAAAAVTHPNIATIYHVDEAEGIVFIAMELVEGKTLREVIAGRPMPIKDALRLATEMAEGLARAHQAGVIHRDLKPDNVIVGSDGHAKILDFGLAKLLELRGSATDAAASDVATLSGGLSREDRILGTPAYMSPEQARGKPLDGRSDIFSLGTILYEMMTGRVPFEGETKTDILSAVIRDIPEPPSKKNTKVPQDMDLIVSQCLQKAPEDRYQHILQVVIELQKLKRVVEPETPLSVTLSGAFKAVQAESKKRQHRALIASIALPITVLCVLGWWLVGRGETFQSGATLASRFTELRARLFGTSGPDQIRSLAVLPLENLSGDPEQEYFADGMTDELISALAKISALKVISRTSVMQYKRAQKPLPEIARELSVDAIVEGTVRRSGERVRITAQLIEAATDHHLWAESYERDLRDVLALQNEVARAIAQEIRVKLTPQEQTRFASARPVNPGAHEAYLKGRYYWNKRTDDGLKKAIGHFERAIEEDPGGAFGYAGLADSYVLVGIGYSGFPSGDTMRKAKDAALKALDLDDSLAEAHTSLAYVKLVYDWDWPAAEREFKRAIELNPNYATAHQWYAHYLLLMERWDQCLAEFERARVLDPLSVVITTEMGWLPYYLRQYDRAIEQYRKALEMDAGFALAHYDLGLVYVEKGMYEEAISEYQEAISLSGGSSFGVAALGHVYAVSGRKDEAQRLLDDLIEQSDQGSVVSWHIALIYSGLGQKNEAFKWFEQAYEERHPLLPSIRVFPPGLDDLRMDQRFKDLVRRLEFPND